MSNITIKKIASYLLKASNLTTIVKKEIKKKTKGYIEYHPRFKKLIRKAVGNKHCIKINGRLYVKTKKCPKQLLRDLKMVKGMTPLTLKQAHEYTYHSTKTVVFLDGVEWARI